MDEEGLQDTENKLIHIGKPIAINEEEFIKKLDELEIEVIKETDNVRQLLQEIVPSYQHKA